MQITFAGVTIGSEPTSGGSDSIVGFQLPKGEPVIQVPDILRATDAPIYPRGNRKRTLTGIIRPAPAASLAGAMYARASFYESLPDSGILVLQESGTTVTFAVAVLLPIEEADNTEGVSYGFKLTFTVSKPVATNTTSVLGTGVGGAILGDGHGNELGTGN